MYNNQTKTYLLFLVFFLYQVAYMVFGLKNIITRILLGLLIIGFILVWKYIDSGKEEK